MPDCSICCETFNKSKHSSIGCSNDACDIEVCRTCVQTYILGEAPHEPACMGCKEVWPAEFLTANMTKTFVSKEIKAITNQRLFEQEQMRFPETQERMVLNRAQKAFDLVRSKSRKCQQLITRKAKRIPVVFGDDFLALMGEIVKLKDEELELYAQEVTTEAELNLVRPSGTAKKTNKAPFVKGCCRDECRGFLSKSWKCGVCELYSCSQCHEAKDEDHECDPDTVATVSLLKQDSKPCPKCACLITKIAGCDHMWCTNCNTGFSWRSGLELDNSRQTNPLYYEFMRRTQGNVPRTIGDNGGCLQGRTIPNPWNYQRLVNWLHVQGEFYATARISMYIEAVRHVHITETRRFAADDNEPLRVRYLTGKMTKKSFLQTITTRQNKAEVKETCRNTLQTFVDLSCERMNAMQVMFHSNVRVKREYVEKLEEIDNIVKMTNETFDKIAETFSRKYYYNMKMISGPSLQGQGRSVHLQLSDDNGPRYISNAGCRQDLIES